MQLDTPNRRHYPSRQMASTKSNNTNFFVIIIIGKASFLRCSTIVETKALFGLDYSKIITIFLARWSPRPVTERPRSRVNYGWLKIAACILLWKSNLHFYVSLAASGFYGDLGLVSRHAAAAAAATAAVGGGGGHPDWHTHGSQHMKSKSYIFYNVRIQCEKTKMCLRKSSKNLEIFPFESWVMTNRNKCKRGRINSIFN